MAGRSPERSGPSTSDDDLLEHREGAGDVGNHRRAGRGLVLPLKGIHHRPVVEVRREVVPRFPQQIEIGADLEPRISIRLTMVGDPAAR